MIFLYLPLFYTFRTRLISNSQKFLWVLSYLVPVLIVAKTFGVSFDFSMIIAILLVYNIYEIGYIYNDTEVIKHEIEPTLRLTKPQLSIYESRKSFVYIVRGAWACFLLVLLYLFDSKFFYSSLLSASILLVLYYLYNTRRSLVNIPLYFALVSFRYFGIFILLIPSLQVLLLVFFTIPLMYTIEFSTKKRFSIKWLKPISHRVDLFRAIYFSILLLLSLIFSVNSLIPILVYLFSYRMLGWFVSGGYR